MGKKAVRIEVTSQQLSKLRQEVFSNLRLCGQERRRAVKNVLPLPADGSPVEMYCDGKFVGTV